MCERANILSPLSHLSPPPSLHPPPPPNSLSLALPRTCWRCHNSCAKLTREGWARSLVKHTVRLPSPCSSSSSSSLLCNLPSSAVLSRRASGSRTYDVYAHINATTNTITNITTNTTTNKSTCIHAQHTRIRLDTCINVHIQTYRHIPHMS